MNNLFLQNETAKKLYKEIKELPIIDYHNHLDPKEIYENKPYVDLCDIWLQHDHYKWRLMRVNGSMSTGSALHRFKQYAEAVEYAYLNPLKDWTQMELEQVFGITDELTSDNYKEVYSTANTYLKQNPTGPKELLGKFRVSSLCTTDDITSDLKYHKLLQKENNSFQVYPTFRPDRLFHVDHLEEVLAELENISGYRINSLDALEKNLVQRVAYFDEVGCKLADHGITRFEYDKTTKEQAEMLFDDYLEDDLESGEMVQLFSYLLSFLMKEYKKRNWTVQFHMGALRNTNDNAFEVYGKDSGYDAISGYNYTNILTEFLNDIERSSGLPRMILYPLNSNHYEEIAVMCGSFSKEVPGKIQLGAAWWFHDHKTAIEKHLSVFSEYLHINHFIGMLTDSRSFLSFVRHDYFRRILCNFIGDKVEQGLIRTSHERLIHLVQNIAYNNSKNYLDF